MADKNEKFLSVEDIEVVYTSNGDIVHAVNGVSFDLNKGETLGLVGETGAGKTTIAKTILRILPDPPAKMLGGKVYLDDEDIWAKSEEEMLKVRGDKIAMIFQDPMTALNPLMTVGEQIVEVLLLHNDYGKATAVEKAKEMLELVGIPGERFVEYPHQFSGGMKQRVVIAMALACDPELVLADEPTTALDVTIQAQVLDLIRNLQKKYNTAMILITHDLGVVAQTCDKVAVIYAGEIIEYGNLEALFDHPTHPYTLGLFGSLPDITREEERLHPIDGMPPDPTNLPEGCSFHPRCPYATEQCRTGSIPLTELAPGHLCRCCMRTKEENR
jgi:peptide/nickel transport system ATP-binding protein